MLLVALTNTFAVQVQHQRSVPGEWRIDAGGLFSGAQSLRFAAGRRFAGWTLICCDEHVATLHHYQHWMDMRPSCPGVMSLSYADFSLSPKLEPQSELCCTLETISRCGSLMLSIQKP